VTLALKNPRSSIVLEIRPQSAFSAFRVLQRAVTPDLENLSSNKKVNKLPLLSAKGVFSRVKKPSDDINSRLFFMNKKGLKLLLIRNRGGNHKEA
jgi:hypothetical protein